MRIWAFPSFYPYDYPGMKWAGIFAHRQYKALIENGADLKVIMPVMWRPPSPINKLHSKWNNTPFIYPHTRVHEGVQIFHPRIPSLLPYFLHKKSYKEKFYYTLKKMFDSMGVKLSQETDIFYSQWLPESFNVQYAAHRFGIKSAVLYIGDDVVVWPQNGDEQMKSFKSVIENADKRFACADYLGREANNILQKEYSYKVIRMGVDYDYFKPVDAKTKLELREKYNLPKDKLIILNVGTAIARKGWLDLFDALSTVVKSFDRLSLVAVHAGHSEFDLKVEAKKRGVDTFLNDLGEIPPGQIADLYKAVDIFCLPSHWEGLANANIEAMSSGLPVITTNVSGHPELVKDGINGVLVPPKRPDILAENLLKLLQDESLRETLSKNGRSFILAEWGNFADNSKELYRELCKV